VVWLGKIDVNNEVSFRWGALMQEKRIRRSSYGDARPARDFPMLARAYLDGRLMLDELITQRIRLDAINEAFSALRDGKVIRSVVTFGQLPLKAPKTCCRRPIRLLGFHRAHQPRLHSPETLTSSARR